MHLKSADAQVFQFVTHLLYTFKILDPIYIALQRNVAAKHPIYKLLYPHLTSASNHLLKSYLSLNETILDTIFSLGGASKHELLNKAFSSTSWNQLVFPKDLKHRGVDDALKLPDYYYRDDGLLVWNATEHFVKSLLQDYYKSEEDINEDHELQNFISDAFGNGMQKMKDFPSCFKSLPEIVEFITTIIWNSSILRSLIEQSQYEFLGWVPNYPGSLLRPAPVKGNTKFSDVLATLPTKEITTNQINFTQTISKPSNCLLLGHYKTKYFSEEQPLHHLNDYRDTLDKISDEIKTKNTQRVHQYSWLSPDKIKY